MLSVIVLYMLEENNPRGASPGYEFYLYCINSA